MVSPRQCQLCQYNAASSRGSLEAAKACVNGHMRMVHNLKATYFLGDTIIGHSLRDDPKAVLTCCYDSTCTFTHKSTKDIVIHMEDAHANGRKVIYYTGMEDTDSLVSPIPHPQASPTNSLPQELVDNIIDELGDPMDFEPRQALKACILVSKSFHHRARQLLLENVVITMGKSTAASLRSAVQATPSLAHHIHSLRLSFDLLSITEGDDMHVEELFNAFMDKNSRANLERLDIYGESHITHLLRLDMYLHNSLFQLGRSFNLTTVRLKDLALFSRNLLLFPNLRDLELENCVFFGRWSDKFLPYQFQFKDLEILRLTHTNLKPIICALSNIMDSNFNVMDSNNRDSTTYAFPNLKILYICFYYTSNPQDIPEISTFISKSGAQSSLENLELVEVAADQHFGGNPVDLDLSQLERLRSLKVSSVIPRAEGVMFETHTTKNLLSSPSLSGPTTLERLDITLDGPFQNIDSLFPFSQDGTNWKSLDKTLLDRSYFPSLSNVNLNFHLRPVEYETLHVEGCRQMLAPEFDFPHLESSPSISFTTNISVGPSLGS